jgi:hypothetical protein
MGSIPFTVDAYDKMMVGMLEGGFPEGMGDQLSFPLVTSLEGFRFGVTRCYI